MRDKIYHSLNVCWWNNHSLKKKIRNLQIIELRTLSNLCFSKRVIVTLLYWLALNIYLFGVIRLTDSCARDRLHCVILVVKGPLETDGPLSMKGILWEKPGRLRSWRLLEGKKKRPKGTSIVCSHWNSFFSFDLAVSLRLEVFSTSVCIFYSMYYFILMYFACVKKL